MFDEGGVKWESIPGGVGLSGKSVVLEGRPCGRPAGGRPARSCPILLQGMLRTHAHQPANQFFPCFFDQMTDKESLLSMVAV